MNEMFERYTENLEKEVSEILEKLCSPEYYEKALALVWECYKAGGRIHVTGIGKMHYLAGYFASLLSSIGWPSYFLDGTEATHGSAGQIKEHDLVIVLCYYGNPVEMIKTVDALKKLNVKLIAVTGYENSYVALKSDVHLNVHIEKEGDSLGKPPRVSVLSVLICIQNLSVLMQGIRGLNDTEYLLWHPSGQLGKRSENDAHSA